MGSGSSLWVVGVNLVIWTGLFAYLLYLDGKVRDLERKS
ncbi:MAG TPA: CcmD family protein [Thermoanaerobaculia bacterium]|nr:CcmD family protein [Thermoanaerobaculia bacterium]